MKRAPNGAPYPPASMVDARSFYHPDKSGRDKVIIYPDENEREVGRPTRYRKDYAHQVRMLAGREWTNDQICEFLKIGLSTFHRWREKHAEFRDAITLARDNLEDSIERSLAARALGYTHKDTHISNYKGDITVTKITKHFPPDVAAAKFWLENQRRGRWTKEAADRVDEKDESPLTVDEAEAIDAVLSESINEH